MIGFLFLEIYERLSRRAGKNHIDPQTCVLLVLFFRFVIILQLRTFPYFLTFQAFIYPLSVQSGPNPEHFRLILATLQRLRRSCLLALGLLQGDYSRTVY